MGARISAGRGFYRWTERAVWPGILLFCGGFWAGVGVVVFR